MTDVRARWDLSDVEVSRSGEEAALRVVERLARDKRDVTTQWATAIRLARANGASMRDIAKAAEVAPQTVSNLLKSKGPERRET